jgi:predicted acetyltransferase
VSTVVLQRGRGEEREREALAQLIQLYVSDFSEFWRPEQRVALQDDGRFPPFPGLDRYWSDPDRSVWFIRVAGALAGFALMNRESHSGLACEHNVGEFFVARLQRRAGVGAGALGQLLAMHAGQWEIAISERNVPAQHFWPRALAQQGVSEVSRIQGDGVRWTGPILRFHAR